MTNIDKVIKLLQEKDKIATREYWDFFKEIAGTDRSYATIEKIRSLERQKYRIKNALNALETVVTCNDLK